MELLRRHAGQQTRPRGHAKPTHKNLAAGGRLPAPVASPTSGIAAAPAARRGRADIVVSTLDDAIIAVLAAAWLAVRRRWERDDGHLTGSG